MAAFGLEETGDYEHALDAGRAAVDGQPRRRVGHPRRRAHLRDAGPGRRGHRPSSAPTTTGWESGNLFTVHNWWHLALYELEAGRPDGALAIYDAEIHHAGSLGVPIEMLDASALLVAAAARRTPTPAAASRRSPTRGRPRPRPRRGTCSTTSTRSWPSPAPAGWTTRHARRSTASTLAATGPRHERGDDRRDRPAGLPGRRSRSSRIATTTSSPSCSRSVACSTASVARTPSATPLQRTLLESALRLSVRSSPACVSAEPLGVRAVERVEIALRDSPRQKSYLAGGRQLQLSCDEPRPL